MLSTPARTMACILLLLACSLVLPQRTLARDLDEILHSGELHACLVPMSPSYSIFTDPECLEDCQVSGPVPRVVEAFVRTLGPKVRPVFHRLEWDEQFHDADGRTVREGVYTPRFMETGKCDVYPSHLTKNEWRLKKLDFATLFLSRMMVLTLGDRLHEFTSEVDLAGKTVAVALNTSLHTWVLERNENEFRDTPIHIALIPPGAELPTVASGDADFTILDAEVSLWESTHRYPDMAVAFPVGPVDELGWAFRKQDLNLRNAVQAYFDTQIDDETSELNRIWKEEYGVTLSQLRLLIQATR